jgi:hypothetical protein
MMHTTLARPFAVAFVAATALLGCAGPRPNPVAPPDPSTLVSTNPKECKRATSSGQTCELQGNRLICHVFVGLTAANEPYVMPYRLNVPGGVLGGTTVLVWHLVDPQLRFANGHGPKDWNKPGAISESENTDDADGNRPPRPSASARRHRLRLDRTVPATPADPHRYVIRFQDDQKVHVCDPIIVNADNN